MAAAPVRRTLAATTIAAMAAFATPTLGSAFAADTDGFAPDFAQSDFVVGGADTAFTVVQNRAGQAVGLPGTIAVEFTQAIKLSRNDYTADPSEGELTPLDDIRPAPPSYLVSNADGSQLNGTVAVDAADEHRLLFTPPAGLADGRYTLHVAAFAGDSCPDIPFGTPSDAVPACTNYDGFVTLPDDAATPFAFAVDSAAPVVTIDTSALKPVSAATVKAVHLSGTTSADTHSLAVTVRSSGGGAARFVAATLGAFTGESRSWSATTDLSALPDGTLQLTGNATDVAGNKSDPKATAANATTALAAHPAAPRDLTVRSADAAAKLAWHAPASTGGHAITSYAVSAGDLTDRSAAPRTATVPCASTCPTSYKLGGLVNGHRYLVTVAATTDVGRGAAANGQTTPRALTTLTAAFKRSTVPAGGRAALSGRLTRTANGSSVKNVVLTITPTFANGTKGKTLRVTTDVFGIWHKRMTVTRSAVYTVRYAGDAATRAATRQARLTVTRG